MQIGAVNEFHDQVGAPVKDIGFHSRVKDSHQVWVVQAGRDADLLADPFGFNTVIESRAKEFNGHIPAKNLIPASVYGGHATLPDQCSQPVSSAQQAFGGH
ncbi:hypothetical protein GCM10027402_30040 [Arthrobacter monumenti]